MTGKIKLNATSGGGSVSFQAPSSTGDDRIITLPTTADGTVLTTTNPKAGNIIQVVQTVKTDSFSTNTGSSYVDVTGMSVTITPSSSSNKILIMPSLNLTSEVSHRHGFRILRDSTAIHIGDSAGNRRRATSGQGNPPTNVNNYHYCTPFLDSPSTTSAITYKLQVIGEGSNTDIYVNRTENDTDGSDKFRFASSMLAMEVAA